MGEYTTFACRFCGYRTEKVRWGAGQSDARVRFMPALCRKCGDITEIELTGRDILMEQFACSSCGSPVFFLERGESYGCPRCAAPDLRILQEGYW